MKKVKVISIVFIAIFAIILSLQIVHWYDMSHLPDDLYKTTDHFIPEGLAEKYWYIFGGADSTTIRKFKLSAEEISELNLEIIDQSSKWEILEGESYDAFIEIVTMKKIRTSDNTKSIIFEEGSYCCVFHATGLSYYNILDIPVGKFSLYYFVYNVEEQAYYVIY